MPFGFLIISVGIWVITYSTSSRPHEEWRVWTTVAIVVLNLGLAILGSAFVHKVKSDLIRKERVRGTTGTEEEQD